MVEKSAVQKTVRLTKKEYAAFEILMESFPEIIVEHKFPSFVRFMLMNYVSWVLNNGKDHETIGKFEKIGIKKDDLRSIPITKTMTMIAAKEEIEQYPAQAKKMLAQKIATEIEIKKAEKELSIIKGKISTEKIKLEEIKKSGKRHPTRLHTENNVPLQESQIVKPKLSATIEDSEKNKVVKAASDNKQSVEKIGAKRLEEKPVNESVDKVNVIDQGGNVIANLNDIFEIGDFDRLSAKLEAANIYLAANKSMFDAAIEKSDNNKITLRGFVKQKLDVVEDLSGKSSTLEKVMKDEMYPTMSYVYNGEELEGLDEDGEKSEMITPYTLLNEFIEKMHETADFNFNDFSVWFTKQLANNNIEVIDAFRTAVKRAYNEIFSMGEIAPLFKVDESALNKYLITFGENYKEDDEFIFFEIPMKKDSE